MSWDQGFWNHSTFKELLWTCAVSAATSGFRVQNSSNREAPRLFHSESMGLSSLLSHFLYHLFPSPSALASGSDEQAAIYNFIIEKEACCQHQELALLRQNSGPVCAPIEDFPSSTSFHPTSGSWWFINSLSSFLGIALSSGKEHLGW